MTAALEDSQIKEDVLDSGDSEAIAVEAYLTALGDGAPMPQNRADTEMIGVDDYVSLSNRGGWLATVKIPLRAGNKIEVFTTEADLAAAIGQEKAEEIVSAY